jgi:lysyl-tRNA synthetase class 1
LIRIALDKAGLIREIYKKKSGSVKEDSWLPLSVICEKCGKLSTTRATNWNGETVNYECGNFVEFANGCGHKGVTSPFDGKAKFPWKVEWAAKFTVLDVSIEGGGKDHSTRGGSRDVADAISREVFLREPPMNIPYEFFNVGGKKMSSSKGRGSSSREIADLLPPHILRFLLIQKEPQRVIEFDPEGDTVPLLFDAYDTYARNYFTGNKDDFARVFELVNVGKFKNGLEQRLLPRFSNIAYLVQMPHVDLYKEVEKLEGKPLGKKDIEETDLRVEYAKRWLSVYAPENFKFEIQKTLPEAAKDFTSEQKDALSLVVDFFKANRTADGQAVHTALHEIKTKLAIEPKVFFEAIYISVLARKNGPKAGWFLSVLDKDFLIERFTEALK